MNKLDAKEERNKELLKKNFNIDFDIVEIELPNDSVLSISIDEQLLMNEDNIAQVLQTAGRCAAYYARWGKIRRDLESYLGRLTDKKDMFLRLKKHLVRGVTSGKPSEKQLEEKAITGNVKDYKDFIRKIRQTEHSIEKIKRIMKAFEMQSELARTIISYNKKETSLTGEAGEPVIGHGKLGR